MKLLRYRLLLQLLGFAGQYRVSHFGILKFLDKGQMHGCQLKYLHEKEFLWL